MFEINKNELIEYPKTSQKHQRKPGIIIQNNNLIYAIGNVDWDNNSKDNPFGVIEYYDIRDKKWNEIDELNGIFDSSLPLVNKNKKRYFQCVLNIP